MNEQERLSTELADYLDAVLPPHAANIPATHDDPLVEVALRLANAPVPVMPPEMLARIQARVLDAAEQMPVQPRVSRLQLTPLLRLAAVFVIVFLAFGATTVAGSTPGDIGYSVKRGVESLEILLASAPETRAAVYLTHAERRVNEAETLLARGQFDSQLLLDARDNLGNSTDLTQTASFNPAVNFEMQAVKLNTRISGIAQAAVAANLVPPDVVVSLLPTPTVTPLPTSTEPPTLTPTILPTATLTPSAIATALPTATNTAQPTDAPTATLMSTPEPSTTATLRPTETATPSATPVPSVTASLEPTLVVTPSWAYIYAQGNVNVRQGPGQQYEIIAVVQPGLRVEIISTNANHTWVQIRLPDDRTGWVLATLISAAPPATSNSDASGNGGNPGEVSVNDATAAAECAHSGKYCNAPGQEKNNTPGDNGATPGPDDNKNNPGNGDNPPGQDNKPPDTGPPENKPPKDDKGKK